MNFMNLHQWFHENQMTLSPEKCYYMLFARKDPPQNMLNSNVFTSSNEEKLFYILLDSKLKLESQISSHFRNTGQKQML